jgi:tRNA(adenine34) deaminase
VDTDSTHPDEGLFLKSAMEIARALATKRVAPKGPASGMRMLNFYINRAGENLSAERHGVLEHAKELLSARIERERSKNEAESAGSSAHTTSAARSGTGHRTTRRASSARSH